MGKSGLRAKLVFRFMIIIIISVGLLEVMIINFVKHYHYKNIEDLLTNQIKISSDFYHKYFSNTSLEENVLINNVDVFWKQTEAQVQIINKNGKLLMDSIGVKEDINKGDDIEKALSGGKGVWEGSVKYNKSKVMAISYPLKSKDGNVEGVIRFITSLEEVDNGILTISSIFLIIGIFVIIATALVSIVIANRIIDPIKELTLVAETMAEGNFKVRSEDIRDDEIGKLSTTLNYMAGEILKRDEIKNQFISNVSHELRTPLTSIKGWAITLNYDGIDKSMLQDGLTIIERECDRLSDMVEELLDFSKFVSGKIALNKTNVDISELLDYIDKHTRLRTEREGINLIIEAEETLGKILIDENRVKQVLINLLDNAIKFTERNGEIILKAYKEDGRLVLLVKDSGCGISEEELPKVKEKFYKGKSSKSKNGIGLSICDEIAKLHNGELVINSKVNLGTEVYVYIPLV